MNALESALDTLLDRSVVVGYSRLGYALRRRWWDQAELRRLDGKTVAVTGANSGMGRAAAAGFAALGARVLMLVRSESRGEEARAAIRTQVPGSDVEVVVCDLSDLGSVRRCAAGLVERHERLHGLINNAGLLPPRREQSVDGIELTFATNVVGPFLLTNLLVPALAAAAPARIVNVSSGGMYAQHIRVDDLQMEHEQFDGVTAYARAKRAQVILTGLWATRLRRQGIVVQAMHPGWADTPGVQASLPRFRRFSRPILRTPEQAADTVLWLATAESPGALSGRFWHDRRQRPAHLLPATRETDAERALLWQRCAELSGWREDESDRPRALSADQTASS